MKRHYCHACGKKRLESVMHRIDFNTIFLLGKRNQGRDKWACNNCNEENRRYGRTISYNS